MSHRAPRGLGGRSGAGSEKSKKVWRIVWMDPKWTCQCVSQLENISKQKMTPCRSRSRRCPSKARIRPLTPDYSDGSSRDDRIRRDLPKGNENQWLNKLRFTYLVFKNSKGNYTKLKSKLSLPCENVHLNINANNIRKFKTVIFILKIF